VNASAPRGLRRLASPLRRRLAGPRPDPFRTLWDASFEPLLAHVDGNIVDVNPACCSTFGYTAEEALRLTVFDLAAPAERASLMERIRTSEEAPFELIGITKARTPCYL
jgi:PAS domain S-box-containing protein